MSSTLGVHLIGQGFGESIIVEMPNGKVGVIDCHTSNLALAQNTSESRRRLNPIIRFIVDSFDIDSLAFVAFSHPHEDHGRGLSHLLEHFRDKIEQIWIFYGFNTNYLARYFAAVVKSKQLFPIEEMLHERVGTFSRELLKIRNLVCKQSDRSNPHKALLELFEGYKSVEIEGEPVSFHFLGPSTEIAVSYETTLANNLQGFVDQNGEIVDVNWKPAEVNHNLISPSLLLEFGSTRIIFGGDMEREGWTDVLADLDRQTETRPKIACHFLKLSHHGSSTGFVEGLFDRFRFDGQRPIALLTPFNRHSRPLPNEAGVKYITPRVSSLYATAIDAARIAARIPPPSIPTPPTSWLLMLQERPELAGALNPTIVELAESVPPQDSVPPEWASDIRVQPKLADLLRPDLKSGIEFETDDEIENSCRLSFYFNDQGEVVEKYVGSAAGQIS